jgi:hypothetical protein
VRIAVEAVTPELQAAARRVDGVESLEIDAAACELVVTVADAERRTPDVVAALVASGARITGVAVERPRLEEVYLQLTATTAGEDRA